MQTRASTRGLSEEGTAITERSLLDYTVACLAGVILVMFKLHPRFNEFYLRAKKHPHPSIRLLYFGITLVQYINQSAIPHFGLNQFDHTDVIFTALNVVHEHLSLSEDDQRVNEAQQMIRNNMKAILEYYQELREKQQEIENLATTAWNNKAE